MHSGICSNKHALNDIIKRVAYLLQLFKRPQHISLKTIESLRNMTQDGKTTQGDLGTSEAESS